MHRTAQGAIRIAVGLAVLVGLCVAGPQAGAATSAYAPPVAGYKVGDPGVIRDHGQYVVLATGRLGEVSTAPTASGPWKKLNHPLLTKAAAWASKTDKSLWAPSVIKLGTDSYVTFYAALRDGQKYLRCIGTGYATTATGPFAPRSQPISCPGRKSAADPVPGLPRTDSIIDATARYLTVGATRGLYLTYKSQRRIGPGKRYYTTVRMVRLGIGKRATTAVGKSRQLTSHTGTIEENPVMVQRGKNNFTLFTSVGGYTLCTYHTEWRHSSDPWHWGHATAHQLAFPSSAHTCATGDADVYPGLPSGSWRIFFSARYPARPDSFKMYVGVLTWSGNTPRVTRLLKPA